MSVIQINKVETRLQNRRLILQYKIEFQIRGREIGFKASKSGEFWRILLPGIYTLEIHATGYLPLEYSFAVYAQGPTVLHLTLTSEEPGYKDVALDRVDQAQDRTPVYVKKIPKNVYETMLNGLNLFNLLTLLSLALH